MAKITKRTVDGLGVGQTVWDSEIRGFGVRCQRQSKNFVVKYRHGGRQRWMTIGQHGSPWTVNKARERAKTILGAVANGDDPALLRDDLKNRPTVSELCDRFLDEHSREHKKASSVRSDEMHIANHIKPLLGRMQAADVTSADIDATKRAVKAGKTAKDEKRGPRSRVIVKGGETVANRVLALMSKMFNLAEKWGVRPEGTNPCRHITRYKERKRERFLSEMELNNLAKVLSQVEEDGTHSPFTVAAIRLLLFTGSRLSEILTLKWEDVEFDRGVLQLSDSKTGSKPVFLPPAALTILNDLPRYQGNPHVICGAKDGAHLVNLQKAWRKIRAMAELDDVRLHDLRHTFGGVAASSGESLPMIGRLLGHTQASTTLRYAHLAADPVRAASDAIGNRIDAAMKGDEGGEIVNFPKSRP